MFAPLIGALGTFLTGSDTSACNTQGTEGVILKNAFPYALCYVLITGLVVWLF